MIPTLSHANVKIEWKKPKTIYDNHEVRGSIWLTAGAQVSPFAAQTAIYDTKGEAEQIVCRTLLRKVYPVELIRELRAIREKCVYRCKNYDEARELEVAFEPLLAALTK